jgi:acyl-coenzyme A synthetase/AMP-(fatty) acid ligase
VVLRYQDVPEWFNVASWFVDRNLDAGRGDRTALIAGEGTTTYAELATLINKVGHVLHELGV